MQTRPAPEVRDAPSWWETNSRRYKCPPHVDVALRAVPVGAAHPASRRAAAIGRRAAEPAVRVQAHPAADQIANQAVAVLAVAAQARAAQVVAAQADAARAVVARAVVAPRRVAAALAAARRAAAQAAAAQAVAAQAVAAQAHAAQAHAVRAVAAPTAAVHRRAVHPAAPPGTAPRATARVPRPRPARLGTGALRAMADLRVRTVVAPPSRASSPQL